MGLSYYRLKQTDFNGQFSYSNIDAVFFGGIEIISIYPNPGSEYIQYIVGSEAGGNETVKVFDALGKEVIKQEETIAGGVTTKKINTAALSSGSYLLRIVTKTQEETQMQFMVR